MAPGYLCQACRPYRLKNVGNSIEKSGAVPGRGEAAGSEGWWEEGGSQEPDKKAASNNLSSLPPCPLPPSLYPSIPLLPQHHCPSTMQPTSGPSLLLLLLASLPMALGNPM